MKLSRDDSLRRSFVVEAEELKKLHSNLHAFAPNPKYRVVCADRVTRESSDVEEILRYENPPEREMLSLQIKCLSEEPIREASITLQSFETPEKGDPGPNLWVRIEGPEDQMLELNQHINDRLSAMAPWWYWMSKSPNLNGLVIFGASVLSAILVWKFCKRSGWPTTDDGRTFLAIGACLAFAVLFVRLKQSLFPLGTFAIGQGAKRHQTREWVRWTVLIGFIVSAAGSFVVALMF